MEAAASAGQVLLSPETAAMLPRRALGATAGPGVLLARSLFNHHVAPDEEIDRPDDDEIIRCLSAEVRAHVLAAPAIGSGITAELSDYGYILARERGLKLDAATIARTTWEMIEPTSIRPKKDGKVYQEKSEALGYLMAAAERLIGERLPILKSLGI